MNDMFAKRLKSLRRAQGISQVQLAEKLGVKKQSVCNWENDNIRPSVEMLEKAADFFGVSTDYLLGRPDKPCGRSSSIDVTGLKPKQVEHIRQIVDDIRGD